MLDDREIVSLFFRREESALSYTAEKYGGRLKKLSLGITGDRLTAEECENDTYLEAWNRIPPHDPAEYLYAFLAGIIRHLSLDVCRSRSALKRSAHIAALTAELEECIPAPDDAACRLEHRELSEAIGRYLLTISEQKRVIFIRRYWYLDSVADIARRMGIGQSNVKMTLLRCRNGLRDFLTKEGYDL